MHPPKLCDSLPTKTGIATYHSFPILKIMSYSFSFHCKEIFCLIIQHRRVKGTHVNPQKAALFKLPGQQVSGEALSSPCASSVGMTGHQTLLPSWFPAKATLLMMHHLAQCSLPMDIGAWIPLELNNLDQCDQNTWSSHWSLTWGFSRAPLWDHSSPDLYIGDSYLEMYSSERPSLTICWSPFYAAKTEYHRLEIYKEKIFMSHSSGEWEVQDQSTGIWWGPSHCVTWKRCPVSRMCSGLSSL